MAESKEAVVLQHNLCNRFVRAIIWNKDMDEKLIDNGSNNYAPMNTLKHYNFAAFLLHMVQGLILLISSQAVRSIKAFSKTVTISYLSYDPISASLISATRPAFDVEIGVIAAVFLILSGLAHGCILVRWDAYANYIQQGINPYRWYEYALSSSLMICAIAILFGCYDLASLVLMFTLNAAMNLFGLLMEILNPPSRVKTNWMPYIFGCWCGLASWTAIFLYFFAASSADSVPDFVYAILFCYVIFFNIFALNMYLQYKKISKWNSYVFGEFVYILLSLTSKSVLGWLVFGGTFQPN